MKFDYSPKRPVATEAQVNEVRSLVRSCILTRKGGMPVSELRDEYQSLTDEEIPFYRLGYNSLFHFLRDCPDIKSDRNEEGAHVLVVNENRQNKHLVELIKKQKDPKTNRSVLSSRRSRRSDSRRRQEKESREQILDHRRKIEEEKEEVEKQRVVEPPVDENPERPVIYTEYNFEDKISVCTEPIVGKTHQLVGDDYFLQLAIKYMRYDLLRKTLKAPITCGTVQSGLTIRKAMKRLDSINTMSNKLVIGLGTVDIYNRHTDEEMIDDMILLLRKLKSKYGYASNQIVLCTIPPMGNISMFGEKDKYLYLHSFNNWIRTFAEKNNYQILDFYKAFTDDNGCIDYQYFQQDARMVSGTPHPHVLFNYFGRQKALRLLLNIK